MTSDFREEYEAIVGDPDSQNLVVLHKHWLNASAVDHHLRRSTNAAAAPTDGMPEALEAQAILLSSMSVISVWYALLWVVVEGYRELKLSDVGIDSLLDDEEKTKALKRFRNATFHY